jgi:SAM-dependent methyltransferase
MEQTPLRDYFNPDVLAMIPKDATRIVEVGCGSGALAREYRKINRSCEYIGIEIVPRYADAARAHCTQVLTANIEQLGDDEFGSLFPSSCWIFSDVLEHLYDPWSLLRRIRDMLPRAASVIAVIPNAQHWTIQARLNCGAFRYEELGLLDRTHIRWFTKVTLNERFETAGLTIVEGGGIEVVEPDRERGLQGIRAMAEAIGTDPEEAVHNATVYQWLVRAIPYLA